MKLLVLASLLPAAAEFDNCGRANGEWLGFDQVIAVPHTRMPWPLWRIEMSWRRGAQGWALSGTRQLT